MAINLNYSTGKSARPTSATFGTAPSQDPSGLQRTGQSLSQMANQFSNISNTLNQQDKSAQELVARKAYAVQQQAANESAQALNDAINNGNTEKIQEAQNNFNALKDQTVNDYLPEDGGDIQVTRDSILTNYGSQYKNLYGSLDRSTRSNKNISIATKDIDATSKKAESGWTQINLQYGAANAVPLEASQQYLNDQFVLDVDRLNYDALPSEALKESFIKNKLDVFNRAVERSFLHAKSDAEIEQLEKYYGNLFQSYDLFNNIPQASEKYDKAVADATKFVNDNRLSLLKEVEEGNLGVLENTMNTLYESDRMVTSVNDLAAVVAAQSNIGGGVKGVDYKEYSDAEKIIDIYTPNSEDGLNSPFSNVVLDMIKMKPEDRPEASQFWQSLPEFLTISPENRSSLVNHVGGFVTRFDTLMEQGRVSEAMATIPMIQKLLSEGKTAEANLYYQEEFVKKNVFENRDGFATELANTQTVGFDFDTAPNMIAGEVDKMFSNNIGNYEALNNNIVLALSNPGNLTAEQQNMYQLMSMILPTVIEQGHSPTSPQMTNVVNGLVTSINEYQNGNAEGVSKVDNLFKALVNKQEGYQEYSVGDNYFGEHGTSKELKLMNDYANTPAGPQKNLIEQVIKGLLYQQLAGRDDGLTQAQAVKEVQKFEQQNLSAYESYEPIKVFGKEFNTVLPTELNEFILEGVGGNQGTFIHELYTNIFDRENLAKGKKSEIATVYTMTEFALLGLSDFDPTGIKKLVKDYGLKDNFQENPIYYNTELGKPTRLGLQAIIKGGLTNEDQYGQRRVKLSGHRYEFRGGERVKLPQFQAWNGRSYVNITTPSKFSVDKATEITKKIMIDEQNIFNMRVKTGFEKENLDRLLDYLDDQGMLAPQYTAEPVAGSLIQKFPN